MADKVHRIHSLPDDSPWTGGLPPAGSDEHPLHRSACSTACSRSSGRSCVAHLRSIRLRHPDATTAEIVRILERRYLAAVTTGGAAVGATAVVPGIGTGVTLALSGVETVGFLEATALFAQSVAEVHGIPVADPDRARALVLTLMLGKEGVDLVAQLAGQAAGKGPTRDRYWGELVTKTIPRAAHRSARRPAEDDVHPISSPRAAARRSSARRCPSASAPPSAAPATTSSAGGCWSALAARSGCRRSTCRPTSSRGPTRSASSTRPRAASVARAERSPAESRAACPPSARRAAESAARSPRAGARRSKAAPRHPPTTAGCRSDAIDSRHGTSPRRRMDHGSVHDASRGARPSGPGCRPSR